MIILKSKLNYPYIYLLIEPNIVLVYQFHTTKYLTSEDLNEGGLFEVYEINHSDEFEQFLHKEHQLIEGSSLWLSQNDTNEIVEAINRQIHFYRQSSNSVEYLPKQQEATHIVMSESAAGSLRVGLPGPKTVIGIPDSFEIGPLWKLHEKRGQIFRNEWLYENINTELEDYETQQKFVNTLLQIENISNEVPIYIWYANNASEQTGLRFILYLLREKTNDIYLMNATDLYEKYCNNKEKKAIFYTGHINADILELLFEKYKDNSKLQFEECRQFHKEWEQLSDTNDVLRLWKDNKIIGLREDHFDSLILESIERLHIQHGTRVFIKVGVIIGKIYEHHCIDIFFLEYRIRYLIYNGLLELKGIPKSMRHYSVKSRG